MKKVSCKVISSNVQLIEKRFKWILKYLKTIYRLRNVFHASHLRDSRKMVSVVGRFRISSKKNEELGILGCKLGLLQASYLCCAAQHTYWNVSTGTYLYVHTFIYVGEFCGMVLILLAALMKHYGCVRVRAVVLPAYNLDNLDRNVFIRLKFYLFFVRVFNLHNVELMLLVM